jgi:hypothetical protein
LGFRTVLFILQVLKWNLSEKNWKLKHKRHY